MLAKIKIAFRYWLAWLLIFQGCRLAFLFYNHTDTFHFSAISVLKSFLYGLRMDASMSSYLSIPVCLFLLASVFIPFFKKTTIYIIYTALVLLPVLLIVFCDLPAYKAWGYRLDVTPLKYLSSPKEAWASVSNLPVFGILMVFVITYLLLYKLFSRFFKKQRESLAYKGNIFLQILFLLVFSGLQIIPLRGGFQLAPLNQSSVYFSTEQYLNLAAINVPWNFMHSLSHNMNSTENPYSYLEKNESRKITDSLRSQDGETEKIINLSVTPNPNIILVVWESLTQKAIDTVKNGVIITPGFNELKKEGIYFSDIYATGDRTDKGIVAVLSGYPAQPTTSIIKIPQKADKLPKLPGLYAAKGYKSAYFYGGELEFANMKAYLMGCGFDQYTSKDDFDKKDQNSKWGAHDGVVKDRCIKDLSKLAEPFFATWLTLSSHEPYETPVNTVIPGKDDESQFLNAVHYADSSVFAFVQQCKQQPFWKNTILIIVADHGHRLPRTRHKIDDFKIPVLLLGGALTQKGKEISSTGSQIDIPATLLAQTGFTQNPFPWSKNLLSNKVKNWAYFTFNNGFGYVEPGRYLIYDNVGKNIIEQQGTIDETIIKRGKAIQQESFADYLEK